MKTGSESEQAQPPSVLVLVVLVEKGLGIDVPGIDVGSDWLTQILAALGRTRSSPTTAPS